MLSSPGYRSDQIINASKWEALAGSDISFHATMQNSHYQDLTQLCSIVNGMFCHSAIAVGPDALWDAFTGEPS